MNRRSDWCTDSGVSWTASMSPTRDGVAPKKEVRGIIDNLVGKRKNTGNKDLGNRVHARRVGGIREGIDSAQPVGSPRRSSGLKRDIKIVDNIQVAPPRRKYNQTKPKVNYPVDNSSRNDRDGGV
ncbi:unnamed protein product [Lasius platythorax]|uniref:Uncharacterized protein n=1 Tax=Lasius platythorax TaxID=488582 RepID=A0AAV2MYT8_9HYME